MNQVASNQHRPVISNRWGRCTFLWRQRKLIVLPIGNQEKPQLPPMSEDSLIDCLQRSPVKLVKLDLGLMEDSINFWIDACAKADKPVFLRIPSSAKLPYKINPATWCLKRGIDRVVAGFLLILFSPIILALAGLVQLSSPGSIFSQQWVVGERGKLFQLIKFNTETTMMPPKTQQNSPLHRSGKLTVVGYWMLRFKLDRLPTLFNVLRGEMTLIGPRPWEISDAAQIPARARHQLNALPGVTGAWKVKAKKQLRVEECPKGSLKHLDHWSLLKDLKYLLSSIPRWISEVAVYQVD